MIYSKEAYERQKKIDKKRGIDFIIIDGKKYKSLNGGEYMRFFEYDDNDDVNEELKNEYKLE
jgi:hypothetical protein